MADQRARRDAAGARERGAPGGEAILRARRAAELHVVVATAGREPRVAERAIGDDRERAVQRERVAAGGHQRVDVAQSVRGHDRAHAAVRPRGDRHRAARAFRVARPPELVLEAHEQRQADGRDRECARAERAGLRDRRATRRGGERRGTEREQREQRERHPERRDRADQHEERALREEQRERGERNAPQRRRQARAQRCHHRDDAERPRQRGQRPRPAEVQREPGVAREQRAAEQRGGDERGITQGRCLRREQRLRVARDRTEVAREVGRRQVGREREQRHHGEREHERRTADAPCAPCDGRSRDAGERQRARMRVQGECDRGAGRERARPRWCAPRVHGRDQQQQYRAFSRGRVGHGDQLPGPPARERHERDEPRAERARMERASREPGEREARGDDQAGEPVRGLRARQHERDEREQPEPQWSEMEGLVDHRPRVRELDSVRDRLREPEVAVRVVRALRARGDFRAAPGEQAAGAEERTAPAGAPYKRRSQPRRSAKENGINRSS